MIVYDKKMLDNEVLTDVAGVLYKGGFISKEQKKFIEKELSVLKSQNNIFVRIGFFLLPAYFIGSIVLFIKLIKKFNKEITE